MTTGTSCSGDIVAILALREVCKDYGRSGGVLRGINLEVKADDFVVIRGRSGIGKSTLLRIMGLLDAPSSGKVLVEERDTGAMGDPELSRIRLTTFGFVFQQFNLIPSLTNVENVELPMQLAGRLRAEERRKRALSLLESFGVETLAARFPGEVSGGEQQRVTVARALANKPRLVLADEPTASLDEVNSEAVLGLFKKINEENQVAVVLTTTSAEDKFQSTRELGIVDGTLRQL
jgi:putative ABC transport system ATP-binding protein